jgi:hypothetical protein
MSAGPAFPKQFDYVSLAIVASHASSHPLANPIPALRGRLFDPLQRIATLQRP